MRHAYVKRVVASVSIPIPVAPGVATIQTPMRSFRLIDDASTTHSLPPHYSRNALFQNRNDAVVRAPHSVCVKSMSPG
jgi:hypothetical protein